jgi:hypothetical protein
MPESAQSAIDQADESLESLAFTAIIKNQVNKGNILSNGAFSSKIEEIQRFSIR